MFQTKILTAECAELGNVRAGFLLSDWRNSSFLFPYMFQCTFAINTTLCAAAYLRAWQQYLNFLDPLPLSYVQVRICVAVCDNC